MTTTVETSSASWRKRHREDDTSIQMELKRPRSYYYRLESESSKASEEDTESVYSIQGQETDIVRDTTDTDSCGNDDKDEFVIEYEVASVTESEGEIESASSSGSELVATEDMLIAAAAAAMCDSSLENWITDVEESDNSSLDETSLIFAQNGFSTCAQCRSRNDNPMYRYCERCFQTCRQCKTRKTYKGFRLCIGCHKDRKRFFPPRPRGKAKRRKQEPSEAAKEPPVKLDTLRSCLNGLSQDSGLGSSQDTVVSSQEWPLLNLDQIVVPDKHLKQDTCEKVSLKRKRYESESSLSDFEVKKPKSEEKQQMSEADTKTPQVSDSDTGKSLSQTSDLGSEVSTISVISTSSSSSERSTTKELCIFCNSAPKDSIFLHTNIAHQCCCYKCAKRTLRTIKRCPICNRSVNKVVKIFTS